LSRYQRLTREAWRSGDYGGAELRGPERDAGAEDPESLRSFVRSRMEWIVEREACSIAREGSSGQGGNAMKLAQHVKFREEKFGGVLFETKSERVFTLSPTGAAVVHELLQGAGDADLVERLKTRYDDPKGTLEKEASDFIASLRQNGLVTE